MKPRPPGTFGPEWLASELARLLPAFPDVSLCVALSGGVDSTALLAALAALTAGAASAARATPTAGAVSATRATPSSGAASATHATPLTRAAASRPNSFQLRALHVDHGLRPASKQWAAHCRALARKLHVPLKVLTTKVARPRGTSLEAAARDARYGLLAAALHPGEVLLTAHHSDDQLETVLLQLLRGSGLPGIAAMPALAPFAGGFLGRPLLSRSRAELETWVREQGLAWVEDDTNVDEGFDRNYLRLRILPLIRDRWPGAATAVTRSARHAAEAQSLLDALALGDVERARYGESLSAQTLRSLAPDRRRNALRFWITRAGFLAPDTRRLEELAGPVLDARPDANPFVVWGEREGAVRAQRHGDLLSLRRESSRGLSSQPSPARHARSSPAVPTAPSAPSPPRTAPSAPAPRSSPTAAPRPPRAASSESGSTPALPSSTHATPPVDLVWSWRESLTYELPDNLGKLELKPDPRGPLNLDALPPTLVVRWRRGGERLSPRPGGPRRALKNLLQESHVPVPDRARLPLLFSTNSSGPTSSEARLLAVADLLLDEMVQATPSTRRRARLHWKKSSH
ncbi:MAG TPA: tRNA lysidine(34) synthetase TilS [Steroidobacteraceae bacterium]